MFCRTPRGDGGGAGSLSVVACFQGTAQGRASQMEGSVDAKAPRLSCLVLTPLHRYPEVKSHQSSSPRMNSKEIFDAFPHLDSGGLVAIVTATFAQDLRQSRLTVA